VSYRRFSAACLASALVLAACGSSGDERAVELEQNRETDGAAMFDGGEDGRVDATLVQEETPIPVDAEGMFVAATSELDSIAAGLETVLTAVDTTCAGMDPSLVLNTPGAVLSYRTFIATDAQCAQLPNSSFVAAYLEDVDFSRANFAGADLSDARLQITAIGADFTGANLRGADFTGSDLSGAIFNSADITNSVMDDLVGGGLTGADFTNATVGCNQLSAGPLMTFSDVIFDDTCADRNINGHEVLTLSGSLLGANVSGLSLEKIFLISRDFRLANVSLAQMASYGHLPRGLDFTGADLSGSDLSDNAMQQASFIGTTLVGANMSDMEIEDSYFDNADLSNADLSGTASDQNSFTRANIVGTDFSRAVLSWNDFSGATFESVTAVDTVVVAVICEDKAGTESIRDSNAVRYYGLCTSNGVVIF
jgi:uncharacterized protein YjbI with pentapeptide repeats